MKSVIIANTFTCPATMLMLVPVMPVFIVVFARCTLARTELEIRYGGMALNNVFHDSSGGNDVVMYYK